MGLKPKVAIYDLTDCEGCEVEIVSLGNKLLALEQQVDIIDWRLGQERTEKGPFDITIIEGTPITKDEIDTLKYLRENSKILIALGACASLAGIPGIMDKKNRTKWYDKVYGKKYKPKGIDALPLQSYVKVDFFVHGCPIDKAEFVKILEELLSEKTPHYRPYSVCFDCKVAGNECRIIDKKTLPAGRQACLGPITQGGCKAVCVSGGSPCYGCFGERKDANVEGLKKVLGKEKFEQYRTMFMNKTQNE